MSDPGGTATTPRPTRGVRSRVTLDGGTHRVDLAVPTGDPITGWLPQALRHVPVAGTTPDLVLWSVVSSTGADLDLASSLGAQGVEDGSVLELVRRSVPVPRLQVRDTVQQVATTAPAALSGRRRQVVMASLASSVLTITVVVVTVRGITAGGGGPAVVALWGLAAFLVGGAVISARHAPAIGEVVVGHAAAVGVLTTLAASTVAAAPNPFGRTTLVHTATVALLVVLLLVTTPGACRVVAAAAVVVLLPLETGAVLALVLRADGAVVAVIVTAVGVALLPVLPRLSAVACGISDPDAVATTGTGVGDADPLAVAVRTARHTYVATSITVTAALVPAGAVLLLPGTGPPGVWGPLIVVAGSVVVAGSARHQRHPVVTAAALGAASLGAAGVLTVVVLLVTPGLGAAAALVGGLVPAAVLTGAAVSRPFAIPAAEVQRVLRASDLLARTSLPLLVLGALGVLAWAWSVGRHLGGA